MKEQSESKCTHGGGERQEHHMGCAPTNIFRNILVNSVMDDFLTSLSGTKEMSPSLSVPGYQPGPFQNAAKKSDQVFIDLALPQTLPK